LVVKAGKTQDFKEDKGVQKRQKTSWKPEKTSPVGYTVATNDHHEIDIKHSFIVQTIHPRMGSSNNSYFTKEIKIHIKSTIYRFTIRFNITNLAHQVKPENSSNQLTITSQSKNFCINSISVIILSYSKTALNSPFSFTLNFTKHFQRPFSKEKKGRRKSQSISFSNVTEKFQKNC
jgi:hypothetical protein